MEFSRPKSYSPNSDRLLGSFSLGSAATDSSQAAGFELDEDDLFSTASPDPPPPPFPYPTNQPPRVLLSSSPHSPNSNPNFLSRFRRHQHGSILDALPESPPPTSTPSSSTSSSRVIPAIPKPKQTQDEQFRFQARSAPVNVPVPLAKTRRRQSDEHEDENEEGEEEEEEMLPPHEIVARARARESLLMTSSVLEGAGRTLKGRDLRQVRNAVWSKIGFID